MAKQTTIDRTKNGSRSKSPDKDQSKIDYFCFRAGLYDEEITKAMYLFEKKDPKASKLALILRTRGGSAHDAYRLARAAKRNYDHLTVIVPGLCKSAGTLVCLAADELAMSDRGELGPLDVQIRKKEEFGERNSPLDIDSTFRALQNHTIDAFRRYFVIFQMGTGLATGIAAKVAADLSSNTMKPIFRQLDPHKIGEMARMNKIADFYGKRLSSANVREDALKKLIQKYPSHEFVIDREEAAADLFYNVRELEEEERLILPLLRKIGIGYVDRKDKENEAEENTDESN